MKRFLFVYLLASFALALSASAFAQAKKDDKRPPRDMPCYLTEQTIKGNDRICSYKCQDGSPEGVTTSKQFRCPNVLFKQIKD
ncbi:MAG: hypothetical protein RLZZ290_1271 [Pseudomonadota bacterium]|jgi:hypothetical protein